MFNFVAVKDFFFLACILIINVLSSYLKNVSTGENKSGFKI